MGRDAHVVRRDGLTATPESSQDPYIAAEGFLDYSRLGVQLCQGFKSI